jgi:hypothetical protein
MSTTPNASPEYDDAVRRVRDLSERMVDMSKRNGLAWLQAYENVLNSMLRLEEQAASASKTEWVTTLASTHADFVRSMSQVYLDTIRQQLK